MSLPMGEGLLADVHRGTLRVGGKAPLLVALLVEKWLGFCYVFVAAIIPAVIGIGVVEVVGFAAGELGSADVLLGAGWYAGLTLGLLTVQAVLGLLVVTALRGVHWVSTAVRRTWTSYTPPFTDQGSSLLVRPDWPPTEWPRVEAKRLAMAFSAAGLVVGTMVTMLLLSIAQYRPTLVGEGVSTRLLTTIGTPGSGTMPVVDLVWVAELGTTAATPTAFAAVAALLAIPGLVFAFGARNLLLLAEVHAWHRLAGASDRLPYRLGWGALAIVLGVYSTLTFAGLYGLAGL